MEFFSFHTTLTPSFIESCITYLDSLLSLEKSSGLLALSKDSDNRVLCLSLPPCLKERFTATTIIKSILCVLLFPITILIWVLRSLLITSWKSQYTIVVINDLISKNDIPVLIENPQSLQNIRHLPPVYTALPFSCCRLDINPSATPTAVFWIDYSKLFQNINLDHITLPISKLVKVAKQSCSPISEMSINFSSLCKAIIEDESGDYVSNKGKLKLARLFTAYIIFASQKNDSGRFTTTIPLDSETFLWGKLLFFDYADYECVNLMGPAIIQELEAQGVLSKGKVLYTKDRVIIDWGRR
ncbi:hypothetical protein CP10139811_0183 [Chlamydia ibidis]|uniref:Uncharacterized protein n=2 Tax=Chlamydia ibidis TaxID=1405396 RepID=S7J5H9_9CHLA|nr:hypothetical protein [Chlamydia ibidis]EPP35287.1 hypothetical protein CP10139811_0183 [Chlamydia ibidis]EQM62799.1 hypothetical protein H359_0626 [Chlamydia ibidis 10-1398/6]